MCIGESKYDIINWDDHFRYEQNSGSCLVTVNGLRRGCIQRRKGVPLSWIVKFKGKTYYVHRIIWKIVNKTLCGDIDHIDGNPLNNNILNLRICPRSVNNRNKKIAKNNKSSVSGISTLTSTDGRETIRASLSINGTRYSRHFSINKYGLETCMRLAREFISGLKELQLKNGFTKRHGERQ